MEGTSELDKPKNAATDDRNAASGVLRIAGFIALVFSSLYYLQFGLQALDDYLPQGILSLVGAFALGRGALLTLRRRPASATVLLGTIPILLLHAIMTLDDPGELPFLIGSLPVPLIAGLVWLLSRRRNAIPRQ